MPLEDILRKIEETAAGEAARILADAEERSCAARREAEAQAESRRNEILASARAEAGKSASFAKARGEASRRQLILKEKQSAIEAVFAEALSSLARLPTEEYEALLLRFLGRAARGGETLVLGPEDRERLSPGFADAARKTLEAAGRTGGLQVQYAASSLGGGFILSRGGVSLNLTFPALVKEHRDEMEMEVARVLFEDQ